MIEGHKMYWALVVINFFSFIGQMIVVGITVTLNAKKDEPAIIIF